MLRIPPLFNFPFQVFFMHRNTSRGTPYQALWLHASTIPTVSHWYDPTIGLNSRITPNLIDDNQSVLLLTKINSSISDAHGAWLLSVVMICWYVLTTGHCSYNRLWYNLLLLQNVRQTYIDIINACVVYTTPCYFASHCSFGCDIFFNDIVIPENVLE